jgi:hypothetical protein
MEIWSQIFDCQSRKIDIHKCTYPQGAQQHESNGANEEKLPEHGGL